MAYSQRLVKIFGKIMILIIVKPRYSEWKLMLPAIHYIEVVLVVVMFCETCH